MIAFFSKGISKSDVDENQGFPLEKAFKYQDLHPTTFSVNDLSMQYLLLDRREVYRLLVKNGIPTAKHVFVSRDNYEPSPLFYEVSFEFPLYSFSLGT